MPMDNTLHRPGAALLNRLSYRLIFRHQNVRDPQSTADASKSLKYFPMQSKVFGDFLNGYSCVFMYYCLNTSGAHLSVRFSCPPSPPLPPPPQSPVSVTVEFPLTSVFSFIQRYTTAWDDAEAGRAFCWSVISATLFLMLERLIRIRECKIRSFFFFLSFFIAKRPSRCFQKCTVVHLRHLELFF